MALTELKSLLEKKNKTASAYSSIVKRAQTQVEKVVATTEKRKKSLPASQPKLEKAQRAWNWKIWLLIAIGVFTFVSVIIAAVSKRQRQD